MLAKSLINTPFPLFQCFGRLIDLSKHNIEVGVRGNLFSEEFKADFCQLFNVGIVDHSCLPGSAGSDTTYIKV